ncbi:MAG: ligase-associated DNA damage response DEXH box helicase [Bdellovibrionota bacterium]
MTLTADSWFESRGWRVFPFQRRAWDAFLAGNDGLIQAATGTGKTYAALFGPLMQDGTHEAGLQVLWLTPLRALANDLAAAIQSPLNDLKNGWKVEARTGDTSSSKKARQRASMPQILITTPESLSLLLSYDDVLKQFESLRAIVVDEWHELLGTKRGVLLELSLSRVRALAPKAQVWGLSATIGNLEEACRVLAHPKRNGSEAVLIRSEIEKPFVIESLIPETIDRFPWAGHLGLSLLGGVLDAVDRAGTTLLFTNVRSQAEHWHRAVREARPDMPVVLHHGSLDRELREEAETKIKSGEAKLAICTSSLDLGVDFPPVDLVIQVGSPKGIARMLQRLGRSGHSPDQISRMLCVPTNAFELLEYSAARRACEARDIEKREPLRLCLDVLVQHILTCSLTGFDPARLLAEVRSTFAFADLTEQQWQWALDFAATGGSSLKAYGQFQRLATSDGKFHIANPQTAKFHRMSIGTIVSDSMVSVKYVKGGSLGLVEESFVAKLQPGDNFVFAGKLLQLIQLRGMVAFVRKGKGKDAVVPRWLGGRLPLSTHLADAVLRELTHSPDTAELVAAKRLLELQSRWSVVPDPQTLVVETLKLRRGFQICLYPFEGFKVHEGLASLLALRLSRRFPLTITSVVNDYGIELLLGKAVPVDEELIRSLLSEEQLLEDIILSLNAAELGKRQFREIARIAGLVFQGYPGAAKTARQLQVSSSLLFEVFQKYDPSNLLLEQAEREVLEQQLEFKRLQRCLQRLRSMEVKLVSLARLSPFAFPLWASFTQTQLSSESWKDRIERMKEELEAQADDQPKRRSSRRDS